MRCLTSDLGSILTLVIEPFGVYAKDQSSILSEERKNFRMVTWALSMTFGRNSGMINLRNHIASYRTVWVKEECGVGLIKLLELQDTSLYPGKGGKKEPLCFEGDWSSLTNLTVNSTIINLNQPRNSILYCNLRASLA